MMTPSLVALIGLATFLVSLGTSIGIDATWHDVLRPGTILPALGQVGGMLLTYLGARHMEPPER